MDGEVYEHLSMHRSSLIVNIQKSVKPSLIETRNSKLQPRASYTPSIEEQQATPKAKQRTKPGKRHRPPRRKEIKEQELSRP